MKFNKEFTKGDVVYKIISTDDGGCKISREIVISIGEIEIEVIKQNELTGQDEKVQIKKEIIVTDKMKINEFSYIDDYFKREELKDNLKNYIDKISYF